MNFSLSKKRFAFGLLVSAVALKFGSMQQQHPYASIWRLLTDAICSVGTTMLVTMVWLFFLFACFQHLRQHYGSAELPLEVETTTSTAAPEGWSVGRRFLHVLLCSIMAYFAADNGIHHFHSKVVILWWGVVLADAVCALLRERRAKQKAAAASSNETR